MSDAPQNRYKADLRDIHFLLFEHMKLGELLGKEPYANWGDEEVKMALSECYRFSCEVTGPLNGVGDASGCKVENGRVKTPEGFKAAWDKLYEAGWKTVAVDPEHGGQGAPHAVQVLVEELLSGSNIAFNMYPGLAFGAAEVIEMFGTPKQKEAFLHRMFSGEFGGTMCLTEPHAGTDVGSATTKAKKRDDGLYEISGTKIFISGGDHDLASNIVHLVLARVEGAPPGTKGLSLFIVPRLRLADGGGLGDDNDVTLGGIEHKMGINGSATCILNFGENGKCLGEVVGGVEGVGMAQMFQMMNGARIAVGIQGIGVASAAFLNALQYAKERKQGPSIRNFKDASAPRVPIIEHADVRRMLLEMKAKVEGIRALAVKLAMHQDRARALASAPSKDEAKISYHKGQVELLTPLVKAYGSDQAFRVCELAIQTLGGAGFIKDYGVEQYCRDAKILSIYEGTNHIQSMDLVGRKLGMHGGMNLMNLASDVDRFIEANKDHGVFAREVASLAKAKEAVAAGAMKLMGWFQGGRLALVPLNSTRFLEMMSELVVGWLLLEQGVIAHGVRQAAGGVDMHPEDDFYEGKVAAAQFYARNILPGVPYKLELLSAEDESALSLSDAAFATV